MEVGLIGAAQIARKRAYCRYSGYAVGAALLDESERIHVGCNVENASYGATLCAERSALARLVSEGGRRVRAVAVATQDGAPPCGICLQSLLEFCPDPDQVPVYLVDASGKSRNLTLGSLVPYGFRGRTERA
ncbi:MAG: cytidine deaminase [Fimbriimonadales bacterium]|nr:cytidine deaminase [Fimbriimonadales bacterium]